MTVKRFEIFPQNVAKDGTLIIIQKGLKLYNISEVVELLNALHEENQVSTNKIAFLEEFLKSGVQYEYYQRVHDENEQLKNRLKDWHQRTFKAHKYFNILEEVIDEVCNDDISNQIWKEYEKREKLVE